MCQKQRDGVAVGGVGHFIAVIFQIGNYARIGEGVTIDQAQRIGELTGYIRFNAASSLTSCERTLYLLLHLAQSEQFDVRL
ncbi:MAG: hypothetical protein ACR5K7_01590 [Symbiopectobacterium sp.]